VDFKTIRWITFEDPHLAEYTDPAWVERAPEGKELLQMLQDGEIDAAIFGSENPEGLTPLIPDAGAAAQDWAERHGGIPINHMLVIRESITREHPEAVREVYRVIKESTVAVPAKNPGALRFGLENVRTSLETIIGYSCAQELIPRRFTVDELFNDVTRSLE
jgi:4,5-dihydroxyphthalate decarboxylase